MDIKVRADTTVMETEVKRLRAAEKAKDKEIDDLWRKLSNFEQVVLDQRSDLEQSNSKCPEKSKTKSRTLLLKSLKH